MSNKLYNGKTIDEMTLMDDVFAMACFEGSIDLAQKILRIILNKPELVVRSVEVQKILPNILNHSVCLDVYAEIEGNAFADIEIQRKKSDAKPKRAKFITSMMMVHVLPKGADYDDLPQVYVIFITQNDYFGGGLPIYIKKGVLINYGNMLVDDGETTIYVNGAYNNTESDLGKLIHDFSCKDPEQMLIPEISDWINKAKHSKQVEEKMGSMLREYAEERVEEHAIKSAKALILYGKIPYKVIAECQFLPLEKILEIAKELGKYPEKSTAEV